MGILPYRQSECGGRELCSAGVIRSGVECNLGATFQKPAKGNLLGSLIRFST